MRVPNLVLLFACALLTLSTPALGVEVQPEKYVHVHFLASYIQDLPNRVADQAPPRGLPLDRTDYKFHLDLYYQPGNSQAPAFATGQFNARRANHTWTTVDLSLQVFQVVTSIVHNQLTREMIARLKASTGREPTFIPYAATQMVFRLIDPLPQGREESTGQRKAHLSLSIAVPSGSYFAPSDSFPVAADILYGVFNDEDEGRTIRHAKLYRGHADVIAMSAADTENVARYLELVLCDERLKSRMN